MECVSNSNNDLIISEKSLKHNSTLEPNKIGLQSMIPNYRAFLSGNLVFSTEKENTFTIQNFSEIKLGEERLWSQKVCTGERNIYQQLIIYSIVIVGGSTRPINKVSYQINFQIKISVKG